MAKLFRVVNSHFQIDFFDAAVAMGIEEENVLQWGFLDIYGFLGKWPNFSAIIVKKKGCSDYWIVKMKDVKVSYIDTDNPSTHIGVSLHFRYMGKDKKLVRELVLDPSSE